MNMKKAIAVLFALLVVGATAVLAAATYTTNLTNINVGDPGFVTFYVETVPGFTGPGPTGATVLILKCNQRWGELITNFEVSGKQAGSNAFSISCTQHRFLSGGYWFNSYTLNSTPLVLNLTMYSSSGPVPLQLTIGPTTFQSRPCEGPCNREDVGSVQITY